MQETLVLIVNTSILLTDDLILDTTKKKLNKASVMSAYAFTTVLLRNT